VKIAAAKEAAGERRVALTPQVARRLVEAGHEVAVEPGLGDLAGLSDAAYVEAGAEAVAAPLQGAEMALVVGPPSAERARALPEGAALIGFLDPFSPSELIDTLRDRRITAFAVEAIPRTTLAQSMDALSSQATAAGYHAVLLAASESPRIFPMLTTAAGTIPPVKALILGAGVAGLQAIATARRLGAVVFAYDIRPEVREQIESLGAKFVAAPVDETAATSGGYAKEVAEETKRLQQAALSESVAEADVVITTAQIPGRPAPLLISRDMVELMGPGSVIVDVAAPTGGNCEVTRPGETVVHEGVAVVGPLDLAGNAAADASQMYAKNLLSLIERLTDDEGGAAFDFDDEITSGACVTHDGKVTHPITRRALGLDDEEGS